MQFYVYKKLMPGCFAELSEFVGEDERFLLRNPGRAYIGNVPAHFLVRHQNRICAYAEAVCIDSDGCLNVEILFHAGSYAAEATHKLIDGIKNVAAEYDLRVRVSSSDSQDAPLLKEGFYVEKADYLLALNKKFGMPEDIMEKRCQKPETEFDFFITEDSEGVKQCSVFRKIDRVVISSCQVCEYSSSVCIADVFTPEEYRRKGFASMLLLNVIRKFDDKDILLHVTGENEAALTLYYSLGFEIKESMYTYIS
ncbi:MAG: GNAT family N-acetyltransferase [Lachnospiraceae bacterium]